MKKQLFSLVMMLALFVLAGTSAKAQDGLAVATAVWHVPGSTHSVTVDASHTGTTYAWVVASIDCAGAGAANPVPTFSGGSESTHTAVFTYPNNASGIYRFRVTETTSGTTGCSTIREFYTAIMDVDLTVIASVADGSVTGLNLESCNDYTLRTTFNPSTLVPNVNADDNSNNLGGWTNALLYNERYVNVTLATSDLTGCSGTVGNAPVASAFHWMFDYTIAGAQYAGNAVADDNNFTGMQAVANVNYVDGANAAVGSIAVAAGTTTFTIPLRSYIRWGTTDTNRDQHFTLEASNVLISSTLPATLGDPTEYTDGGESTASAAVGNESTNQVIHASPATPRITSVY